MDRAQAAKERAALGYVSELLIPKIDSSSSTCSISKAYECSIPCKALFLYIINQNFNYKNSKVGSVSVWLLLLGKHQSYCGTADAFCQSRLGGGAS